MFHVACERRDHVNVMYVYSIPPSWGILCTRCRELTSYIGPPINYRRATVFSMRLSFKSKFIPTYICTYICMAAELICTLWYFQLVYVSAISILCLPKLYFYLLRLISSERLPNELNKPFVRIAIISSCTPCSFWEFGHQPLCYTVYQSMTIEKMN